MVQEQFRRQGVENTIVNLRNTDHDYGISSTVDGRKDDITRLLRMILDYDGLILATPVWWGVHSSVCQMFMERMTYFDDQAIRSQFHPIYGKIFGSIITASGDGHQHTMGIMYNWAVNLGFTVPPDAYVNHSGSGQQTENQIANNTNTQTQILRLATNMRLWSECLQLHKTGWKAQTKDNLRVGELAT